MIKIRTLASKLDTSKKFIKIGKKVVLAHRHPTLTLADKLVKRALALKWEV